MRIYSDTVMESSSCPDSVREPGRCAPLDSLRVNVQGRVFEVDKALLAHNCEYFRALFQSGMRECQQEEIHLRCVGVLGFLVMLRVLDGERPLLDEDQIVGAIECAAFLQVPSLVKHLIDIVNSDNCLLMYHTAATYGAWDLSHSSALFIRDMYADLREEVRALPRKLVEYVESLVPSSYMAVCSHSPSTELLQDFQRTVCCLDEDNKEWKVLTHLPMSSSTTMAGVTVLDNKLYIVGGVHDVSKRVVETCFCYDPASDTWSTFCGPQQLRYNFTLIGHEGCLYAIGGEQELKAMSSVERYQVSNRSWSFLSHLPSPAATVAAAKTMSRLFICLWRGKGATDIYEYVPEKDQWTLVTTLVREQSYGLCMVAHKDTLYVMRNGPCNDFLLCLMDCYNLSSCQWTAVPGQYLNSKGSLLTAVVRGDSVFTLNRRVTTEYSIEDYKWRTKRETTGFGRIGTIYTFLMRLPKTAASTTGRPQVQTLGRGFEGLLDGPRLSVQCLDNV